MNGSVCFFGRMISAPAKNGTVCVKKTHSNTPPDQNQGRPGRKNPAGFPPGIYLNRLITVTTIQPITTMPASQVA